ncbi:MAG: (Fe-S)-binding protein [Bacteroidia bacterium]|nr:(Fe-S)-binding protein [Bacteroidia bacterium]
MLQIIIFSILLVGGFGFFFYNVLKVRRNILLGKDFTPEGPLGPRVVTVLKVAFGQSKMVTRPLSAIMHIFVYVGFILINIEVLEMFADGITGRHRTFSSLSFYNFLIAFFEILALLVFIGVVVFWLRRNVAKVKRFMNKELDGFPRLDANAILIAEVLMMTALMLMNASDQVLQSRGLYKVAGSFPLSQFIAPLFNGLSNESLHIIEKSSWWFHIVGIFAFMNYLPYSKHFHILLAFPATFYSNFNAKGKFTNLDTVTDVVKPNFDSTYIPKEIDPNAPPIPFGVKDVFDLNWKQLLEAYTCTECGRCTSSCPQNMTGKLLSPRKIMMDTRDRLVEVGKNIDKNGGKFVDDGKTLLGTYITPEELWACNTCNACVQECPINLDPLAIIVDLRRFLVMEKSEAPPELNNMFSNIENNGAPWQFSPADRANWINE